MTLYKGRDSELCHDVGCFVEIIYSSAQTIPFENADNFSMENADRLFV